MFYITNLDIPYNVIEILGTGSMDLHNKCGTRQHAYGRQVLILAPIGILFSIYLESVTSRTGFNVFSVVSIPIKVTGKSMLSWPQDHFKKD